MYEAMQITKRSITSGVIAIACLIASVYFMISWFNEGMPFYAKEHVFGKKAELIPFLGTSLVFGAVSLIAGLDAYIYSKSKS